MQQETAAPVAKQPSGSGQRVWTGGPWTENRGPVQKLSILIVAHSHAATVPPLFQAVP